MGCASPLPSAPDPVAGRAPIRVMIVDDSIVARTVLARMLEEREGFEVVAAAGTANAALGLLDRVQVDIVLLDLEMPGLNGLSALPAIVDRSGGARVLIVSSACAEGAEVGVTALRLGAADTLLKPQAGGLGGRFADALADRLRRIAADASPPHGAAPAREETHGTDVPAPTLPLERPVDCIGIGASTGGVHALAEFFEHLPAAVRAPILVTQHLPLTFTPFFAAQLKDMARRPVRVAVDGLALTAGEIVLAPGDAHLTVARTRGAAHVRLARRPMPSGCTPSVDPMLESIARVFGASGVGVILSGMGRDGALGAGALAQAGGAVLAQDAASSVVWGMPGVVAEAGIAMAVQPPAGLARIVGGWAAAGGVGARETTGWGTPAWR